jgi:hypothetical protein
MRHVRQYETMDDSELTRLLELLDSNGFDVQDYDAHGYAGELTCIKLTVYPRTKDQQDNATKDEGTTGS